MIEESASIFAAPTWHERARKGALVGARLSAVYVLALVLLNPVERPNRQLSGVGVFLAVVLLVTFGPVGGVIAALLRPRIHDVFGAALVAALVLALPAGVLALLSPPSHGWSVSLALKLAMMEFAVGSVFGAAVWLGFERQ